MLRLRDYQQDCFERIKESISAKPIGKEHYCIGAFLPTGGGKTAIMGAIAKDVLENDPYARVVIISHLSLLTTQTTTRFKQDFGIECGVLQGDHYPSHRHKCVISTMQSFRKAEKITRWLKILGFTSDKPDLLNVKLIIIDECHFMGNDSYDTIMSMFKNATIIGFTATPFRQNKLISNMFTDIPYTISTQELIDKGSLVPAKLSIINSKQLNDEEIFASIVSTYKNNHLGDKAVCYLNSIENANILRQIFIAAEIRCEAVTSELKGDDRDVILSEFREKDLNVLTTVDVLTAGFDVQNLSVIFMPYAVNSVTTYLQRVGRGLRIFEGKEYCSVYAACSGPTISKKYWEKIQRKAFNAGKVTDNYKDDLELNEDTMSDQKYEWTKDICDMANRINKNGYHNLPELIINKQIPEKLLNCLKEIKVPIASRKLFKDPASSAQQFFLKKHGINYDNLSKEEASFLIEGLHKQLGIQPNPLYTVPHGRFAGYQWRNVPPFYIKYLAQNAPTSGLYKNYLKFKEITNGKRKHHPH